MITFSATQKCFKKCSGYEGYRQTLEVKLQTLEMLYMQVSEDVLAKRTSATIKQKSTELQF